MIRFEINSAAVEVSAPAGTPILWVIREHLKLTGTKFGCGVAQCGSCTIHIDGKAVRACVTPVSAAEGKRVTTIEGLSPSGTHPLQKAWLHEQTAQCGYCQPGQIMQAAALLAGNPDPSRDEIVKAMDGHLCRCGTYLRIIRAIQRAAGEIRANGDAGAAT